MLCLFWAPESKAVLCLERYREIARLSPVIPSETFSRFEAVLAMYRRNITRPENFKDRRALSKERAYYSSTLRLSEEMQRALRSLGFQTHIEQRQQIFEVVITDFPPNYWLGEVMRSSTQAGDRSRPLTLRYNPLFDLMGFPMGEFDTAVGRATLNSARLLQAIRENFSDILLHEISHNERIRRELALRIPPGPNGREPVSVYIGSLFPIRGSGAAFFPYENALSIDELFTHRRQLLQLLGARREAEYLSSIHEQELLARIPRLHNQLSRAATDDIMRVARRLTTFGNSIDVLISRWLREIERNPERISFDDFHTILRNRENVTYMTFSDGTILRLPVPVEIDSEPALRHYIFDYLTRLREQAVRDRELGGQALAVFSNR